jgi:hypothetical protein
MPGKDKGKKPSGSGSSIEVSSGSRPIEGVGTAVAAFVGIRPLKPLRLFVTGLVLSAVVSSVRGMAGGGATPLSESLQGWR